MNGKINLCIITDDRTFDIPFATIRQLDMFTVRYNEKKEIIDSLIRILELPISIDEVKDLNIRYVHSDKLLPIKYAKDNYDTDSVVEAYIYYLQSDQRRLDGYGIRNVVKILEPDYKNKRFSDREVSIFAKRYLKDDYRKIRDAYFLMKNHLRIRINKVNPRKKHKDVIEVPGVQDDYLDFLISSFNRSEEEYMMALEELSLMDLEELEIKLGKYNMNIIDGLSFNIYDACDMEDIDEITRLTGIDIESLKYMVIHDGGHKKKR